MLNPGGTAVVSVSLLGLLIALGGLAAVVVCLVVVRNRAFDRMVRAEASELASLALYTPGESRVESDRGRLPEPIQRYLRLALPEDAGRPRLVRITHTGRFRTKPGQNWIPIRGVEWYATAKPGFLWSARGTLMGFLWVKARDKYVNGSGSMLIRFLSSVTLGDASGPEIDQGAALRWLGETPLCPAAFLSPALRWEPRDSDSVRVTLEDSGHAVTGVLHVNEKARSLAPSILLHYLLDFGGPMLAWVV